MDMDCDLDVLLCPTIHVDGGTYRIQSAGADFRFHAPAPSTRDELAELDDDEAEEDGDPSIVEEQRGGGAAPSFRSAVSAAEEVFGFIIGKGGKNKQSIEQDTGATLHFPPNNRGRGPPAKRCVTETHHDHTRRCAGLVRYGSQHRQPDLPAKDNGAAPCGSCIVGCVRRAKVRCKHAPRTRKSQGNRSFNTDCRRLFPTILPRRRVPATAHPLALSLMGAPCKRGCF